MSHPAGPKQTEKRTDNRTDKRPARTADRAPADDRELLDRYNCSITASMEALKDTWSILVIRELFFGVRRFNDIQNHLGISRSVLTDRLAHLVAIGIARMVPYQEPGDRVRNEYRLTRKGVGLLRVMVAFMEWGDEHVNGGEGPVSLHDRATGEPIVLELRTASGKLVEPSDIVPVNRAKRRRARAG